MNGRANNSFSLTQIRNLFLCQQHPPITSLLLALFLFLLLLFDHLLHLQYSLIWIECYQWIADFDEAHETTLICADGALVWDFEAEKELKKIPFFVRGKARRNTEKFAVEHGLTTIEVDTLYDAKAHFSN